MRCLQVFSAPDGGVPEHVLRLALALRERGWQSWVAGPESASNLEALDTAGIPVCGSRSGAATSTPSTTSRCCARSPA